MSAKALFVLGMASLITAPPCWADDNGEDAELTMTLITDPDAELPEAITKTLVLPAAASAAGMDNSAPGQGKGNAGNGQDAPDNQGLDIANEAKERGKEFGQENAEAAQENRENRGRGPDNPPDRPEPPRGPPQN